MPTVRLTNLTYPGPTPWLAAGPQPTTASWVVGDFYKFDVPVVFDILTATSASPNGYGVAVVAADGATCTVDVTFPDAFTWRFKVAVVFEAVPYLFVSDGLTVEVVPGAYIEAVGPISDFGINANDATIPGDAVGAHLTYFQWQGERTGSGDVFVPWDAGPGAGVFFDGRIGGFGVLYPQGLIVADNFGRKANILPTFVIVDRYEEAPSIASLDIEAGPAPFFDDMARFSTATAYVIHGVQPGNFNTSVITYSWVVQNAGGDVVASGTGATWRAILPPGAYTVELTATAGMLTETNTASFTVYDPQYVGALPDVAGGILVACDEARNAPGNDIHLFRITDGLPVAQIATIAGHMGPSLCKGREYTLFLMTRRRDDLTYCLWTSCDNGATWTAIGSPWDPAWRRATIARTLDGGFASVAIEPDASGNACSPGRIWWRYSPDGVDWTNAPVAVGLRTTAAAAPCALQRLFGAADADLFVTDGFTLWQSHDYGKTWAAIANDIWGVGAQTACVCPTLDGGFMSAFADGGLFIQFKFSADGIAWPAAPQGHLNAELPLAGSLLQLMQFDERGSANFVVAGSMRTLVDGELAGDIPFFAGSYNYCRSAVLGEMSE